MASPARTTLESAPREKLESTIRKLELLRRNLDQKLKDEIASRESLNKVLESNNLPIDDIERLASILSNHVQRINQSQEILQHNDSLKEENKKLRQQLEKREEQVQNLEEQIKQGPKSMEQHSNKTEIEQYDKTIQEKDDKISTLETLVRTERTRVQQYKQALKKQREESNGPTIPRNESKDTIKLTKELSEAKRTIAELEDNLQFAEQEIDSVKASYENKIKELQKSLDWNEGQANSFQATLEEAENEFSTEKLQLQKEIKQLKKEISCRGSNEGIDENILLEKQTEIDLLNKQLAAMLEKFSALQQENSSLVTSVEQQMNENSNAGDTQADEVSVLTKRIAELEDNLRAKNLLLKKRNQELLEVQNRVQKIEEQKEEAVSGELQANNQAKLVIEQVNQLKQELEEISRQYKQNKELLEEKERECSESASEIENLKRRLSTSDGDLGDEEDNQWKEQANKLKQQVESILAKQRDREQEWVKRKEALNQAADQVNKQRERVLQAKNQIEVRNLEIAEKEKELEARAKQAAENEEEIRSLRATVLELNKREQEQLENTEKLEVKVTKLKELYQTIKKQKEHAVHKSAELERQMEAEKENYKARMDEATENAKEQLTQHFESIIDEFRLQITSYEEKITQQEEETRQLMVQYNSVLQSSSVENDERMESLQETVNQLQIQLKEQTKRAAEVTYLESELRTVLLQVQELEKRNESLISANAKQNSMIREEQSWKEQYDSLFSTHQELLNEHARNSKAMEESRDEEFTQLHQRLKEQRDLIHNLRQEKEEMAAALQKQISSHLLEIESLKQNQEKLSRELQMQSNYNHTGTGNNIQGGEHLHLPDTLQQTENPAETNTNLFFYQQIQNMNQSELQEARKRAQELQELLDESEATSQLHLEQIQKLKEEIRNLERSITRDNGNMEYLKNIIIKYMETDDHEQLYPVISHILQFSPAEKERIQNAKQGVFGNWKLWK